MRLELKGAVAVGLLVLMTSWAPSAVAQSWVRITDASNPIVTDPSPANYTGASWVDIDGDQDLDLYVNNASLYRNEGGGTFVKLTTFLGFGIPFGTGQGNTWADYDNDGDLDCYVSGNQSALFQNQGDGTFVKQFGGHIGDTFGNRGWACSFADIDNDGDVDLSITHPCGFVPGACISNRLLINSGPPLYFFTRQDTGVIVTGFDAYTVGSWYDYDLDGDQDHFVGSGPASATPDEDNLYRNLLSETGVAFFERITDNPIATDLVDGQQWSWIDYDNDRDLDGFLTNWGGNGSVRQNKLYRNDGGTYVSITGGSIVTDNFVSLANMWGDYDNDGDLDCYTTNDSGQRDAYYRSNGAGAFLRVSTAPTLESISHRGGTAGDYDGDGDLDLFLVGPSGANRLYRNDLAGTNGWLVVATVGTVSNRAGIGARLELKATLGGVPTWQMRTVSAQSSFNGMSMLDAHFGLRDATVIDSLVVTWPSGIVDVLTNVGTDQRIHVVEGEGLGVVSVAERPARSELLSFHRTAPNPFGSETTISFGLSREADVDLTVFDLNGRVVSTLIDGMRGSGHHDVRFVGSGLDAGMYFYRLRAGDEERRGRLLKVR